MWNPIKAGSRKADNFVNPPFINLSNPTSFYFFRGWQIDQVVGRKPEQELISGFILFGYRLQPLFFPFDDDVERKSCIGTFPVSRRIDSKEKIGAFGSFDVFRSFYCHFRPLEIYFLKAHTLLLCRWVDEVSHCSRP